MPSIKIWKNTSGRTFLGIVLFIFVCGLIVTTALYLTAEPKLKSIIERKASLAIKGNLQIEKLGIDLWPLGLKLENVTVSAPSFGTKATIPLVQAVAHLQGFSPLSFHVALLVNRPVINAKLPLPEEHGSTSGRAQPVSATDTPFAASVEVKVVDATVSANYADPTSPMKIHLTKMNIQFSSNDLTAPMFFNATTNASVEKGALKLDYPVSIKSELLVTLGNQTLKVNQSQIEVGGIAIGLNGWTQWSTQTHDWNLITNIPEIKNLKAPPSLLPPGRWSGAIVSAIKVKKKGSWTAGGTINIKNLQGQIDWKMKDAVALGQVSASVSTEFRYADVLTVKSIKAESQMKDLGLRYKDLFMKPATVPLDFSIDASMEQDVLNIKSLAFTLAQLKGSSQGVVAYSPGHQSNLSIKIPKTSLAGFEKLFTPLSSMPVQGNIQTDIELKGDLQSPNTMSVRITPLLLENVRANINFKNEGLVVKGPAQVNMRAVIVAEGPNLKSSNIVQQVDLSGMQIQMADKFVKPAGSPLKLDIVANQQRQKISIQKGALISSAGLMNITGDIQNPQSPNMNLRVIIPKLNLTQVAELVPLVKSYGLSGQADANVTVRGTYDFKKGIDKSLLYVVGNVSANIPKFTYKSKPKSLPGSSTEIIDPPAPEPILPSWPIAQQLDLKSKVSVGLVQYDGANVERITWDGRIQKGMLAGQAGAGKFFGGKVDVSKIKLNLAENAPTTDVAFTYAGVDIGGAFDWAFPSWKGMIKGTADGRMAVVAAHPSRKDFIQATKARGEATLKNGFLSTLKFDELVSDKLSKIPGLNAQKLTTKGASANIETKFNFLKSQLNFETLVVKTPERNELQAVGFVALDKHVDLKGTIHLAQSPLQGCAREANSDASGRLVVPVKINGNAFNPDLNLTDETAQKFLGNAAKCELEKGKKQVQAQAQAATQKELDKGKQKVQEELTKGLKGIFGK